MTKAFAVNSVASNLEEGSIIATDMKAFFKKDDGLIKPWLSTDGGSATNAEADYYLERGAVILRKGKSNVIPQTFYNKATHRAATIDRVLGRVKSNPSDLDFTDDSTYEVRKFTEAPQDNEAVEKWKEARLQDETHLTEEQVLNKEGDCSIKSPHLPHKWGKSKNISCKGYVKDPQGLSFGSVVSTTTPQGHVENWLKVSEGKYAWRNDEGKVHSHNVIVTGVKSGDYNIIRWGV